MTATTAVVSRLLRSLWPCALRCSSEVRARLVETTARVEGRRHLSRRPKLLLLLLPLSMLILLRIIWSRGMTVRGRRHLTHLNRVKIIDVEADTANSLHGLRMRLLHVTSTQLVRVWAGTRVAVSRLSSCLIEQLRRHLLQIVEIEVRVRLLLLVLMVDRSCVHHIMVLSLMRLLLILLLALMLFLEANRIS